MSNKFENEEFMLPPEHETEHEHKYKSIDLLYVAALLGIALVASKPLAKDNNRATINTPPQAIRKVVAQPTPTLAAHRLQANEYTMTDILTDAVIFEGKTVDGSETFIIEMDHEGADTTAAMQRIVEIGCEFESITNIEDDSTLEHIAKNGNIFSANKPKTLVTCE